MRGLAAFFLLTVLLSIASCKRSDVASNQDSGGANSNNATVETLTTPPFATREPERYQALRVITSSLSGATGHDSAAETLSSQTFIARDGDKRREDYETPAGLKISLLQLPSGTYILLPDKKLYAESKPEADGVADSRAESAPEDFSPEKLLNETRPEAHYEKLGAENVNGRSTVKYRVTLKGPAGTANEVTTESLVWVDEGLGMPIKSETTSTGGGAAGAHVTMELRDIKETVDASLFELPTDYRKVEAADIRAQLKQTGQP